MRKTSKYRLFPTEAQGQALDAQLGEACRLYNAALQERRDAYQKSGVSLNYYNQANQLKAIRAGGSGGQPDPVITDHALYLALGCTPQERHTAYRALCQEHLHQSLLQEIQGTGHQSRVLGTESFQDTIEAALARRVRPGKAGRPRKQPRGESLCDGTASAAV